MTSAVRVWGASFEPATETPQVFQAHDGGQPGQLAAEDSQVVVRPGQHQPVGLPREDLAPPVRASSEFPSPSIRTPLPPPAVDAAGRSPVPAAGSRRLEARQPGGQPPVPALDRSWSCCLQTRALPQLPAQGVQLLPAQLDFSPVAGDEEVPAQPQDQSPQSPRECRAVPARERCTQW